MTTISATIKVRVTTRHKCLMDWQAMEAVADYFGISTTDFDLLDYEVEEDEE